MHAWKAESNTVKCNLLVWGLLRLAPIRTVMRTLAVVAQEHRSKGKSLGLSFFRLEKHEPMHQEIIWRHE